MSRSTKRQPDNTTSGAHTKEAVCACGYVWTVPIWTTVLPTCRQCGHEMRFVPAITAATALRDIALREANHYGDLAVAATGVQARVYARIAMLHAERALALGCADALLPTLPVCRALLAQGSDLLVPLPQA